MLYGEGLFVGYRYYEAKGIEPLFPFGHGLSYTFFAYDELRLSHEEMEETETLTASCRVKNTGGRGVKRRSSCTLSARPAARQAPEGT